MDTKPRKKVISVRRVIGRYEVEGTITCIPAPRPGIETALVKLLIDERVANMVKNKMLEDCFSGDFNDTSTTESVVLGI